MPSSRNDALLRTRSFQAAAGMQLSERISASARLCRSLKKAIGYRFSVFTSSIPQLKTTQGPLPVPVSCVETVLSLLCIGPAVPPTTERPGFAPKKNASPRGIEKPSCLWYQRPGGVRWCLMRDAPYHAPYSSSPTRHTCHVVILPAHSPKPKTKTEGRD